MKLECVCEFSLHSNIMSMQSIGFPNLERDALLLSFRDAKLSIVDYDPDNHDLRTLSLHYFEEEDLKVSICNICFLAKLQNIAFISGVESRNSESTLLFCV